MVVGHWECQVWGSVVPKQEIIIFMVHTSLTHIWGSFSGASRSSTTFFVYDRAAKDPEAPQGHISNAGNIHYDRIPIALSVEIPNRKFLFHGTDVSLHPHPHTWVSCSGARRSSTTSNLSDLAVKDPEALQDHISNAGNY